MTTTTPILTNYPGGKNADGVYQRIINLIPPHATYIEPFLGSGAIMRRKRPAPYNIGLDLDPDVIQAHQESDEYKAISNEHSALSPHYSFLTTDAITYLQSYPFTGNEFIYADPPYVISSRASQSAIYKHEYTDADHIALLDCLKLLPCNVMISGYHSQLYADHLSGWQWHSTSFTARTRGGNATEWLWMNYPPPVALHDYQYIGEDFRERERIKRKKARWLFNLQSMPTKDRQAILWAIQEANLLPESPTAPLATPSDTHRYPSPPPAMADATPHVASPSPTATPGDSVRGVAFTMMGHAAIMQINLTSDVYDEVCATFNSMQNGEKDAILKGTAAAFVASLTISGDTEEEAAPKPPRKFTCPVCGEQSILARPLWFNHYCDLCNSSWTSREKLFQGIDMAWKIKGEINMEYIRRPLL